MGKLLALISVFIFCNLQNMTFVIAGSYSFVSSTTYQKVRQSDLEYLRSTTNDSAEQEIFKTLKPDNKGNFLAPISHYTYTIQHPTESKDVGKESGKIRQPSVAPTSTPVIPDILSLLSSGKLKDEMKHREDTSVPNAEEYDKAQSYSGAQRDSELLVDFSLIAAPSSRRRCRNSIGRGKQYCGQRRLVPKNK